MELKGYQREFLAAKASTLEPSVWIGKNGGSDQVISALNDALARLELVKVRFVAEKENRKEIASLLEEKTSSTLVRIIGNVGIFFREAAEPDDRKIRIPRK